MKRNSINYNGTTLFGSIFNSLFTPVKETIKKKPEPYVAINLRET